MLVFFGFLLQLLGVVEEGARILLFALQVVLYGVGELAAHGLHFEAVEALHFEALLDERADADDLGVDLEHEVAEELPVLLDDLLKDLGEEEQVEDHQQAVGGVLVEVRRALALVGVLLGGHAGAGLDEEAQVDREALRVRG